MTKVSHTRFVSCFARFDAFGPSARVSVSDLILHEPRNALHARNLARFWAGRPTFAPHGVVEALLWVADKYEEKT